MRPADVLEPARGVWGLAGCPAPKRPHALLRHSTLRSFEAFIVPYRSLTRKGVMAVVAVLLAANAAVALRFWLLGAWPVVAFSLFEVPLAVLLPVGTRRCAPKLQQVWVEEEADRHIQHAGQVEQAGGAHPIDTRSYFCTCWKVRPSDSPSRSWLMPSNVRRRRMREPTCKSMGLGELSLSLPMTCSAPAIAYLSSFRGRTHICPALISATGGFEQGTKLKVIRVLTGHATKNCQLAGNFIW